MNIASASSVVKIHEYPSTALIHSYQPHSKIVGSCRSLSWSKDGSWLAVVPHSGFAEIVTIKGNCKLLHTVQNISEPSCASFQNLTKKNIAVGTKYGQVLLYDIKAQSVKARYPRTSSAITHVGFTAKDTHCYAGCANGEILLFNNVARNLSCTLNVPKSSSLTDIKAHVQKRNCIIAGSNEGIIAVWDINVNKIKFCNEAHNAPVTATLFSPINASLIISAGLDRQVCVFDIESRQRVSHISVENNILSLDFLDESKYIVMGAQNGKLHIYDTRNLPDPVCSFDAHQSAIRHISYQGRADEHLLSNSGSSLGNIVSEEAARASRSNEEVQGNKKRTSDFFGMLTSRHHSASDSCDGSKPPAISCSMEGGDSFIQMLGLDKNNTADSSIREQGDYMNNSENKLSTLNEEDHAEDYGSKFLSDNKSSRLNYLSPNPSRLITEKLGMGDSKKVKQNTSTPKLASENFLAAVSPIVGGNINQSRSTNTLPGVSVTEIQNATKEIIHEEVKKALEEVGTKVTYQFMRIAYQQRRMLYDIHMAILKEFIKVEGYCNTIREEIKSEPARNRDNLLLEENMNLRNRIQELESQISSLTIRSASTTEENANEEASNV